MDKVKKPSNTEKELISVCPDYATPLSPQKLALTSPKSSGRSAGIVHSRTEATEFILLFCFLLHWIYIVKFGTDSSDKVKLSEISKQDEYSRTEPFASRSDLHVA
jgi:hypothetical protein